MSKILPASAEIWKIRNKCHWVKHKAFRFAASAATRGLINNNVSSAKQTAFRLREAEKDYSFWRLKLKSVATCRLLRLTC